jgi:hypothetical protein
MTEQEMSDFLESIGGLKNGYKPKAARIKDAGIFECNAGWYPLLKELITDLIDLGWDKQICQVKEKFGGLRFYINTGSTEVFERIHKAEKDSYTICEETGKPGKLRNDIGWIRTLCDEEYEKLIEKRKQ